MDVIFINELRVQTLIGVYEWEKKLPQTIQLDLEIGLPGGHAATSDSLADTLDYSKIVGRIESLLHEHHYLLLEAAGEAIARTVMDEFKAPWVKVSIAKIAPRNNVKRLGVSIERGKKT